MRLLYATLIALACTACTDPGSSVMGPTGVAPTRLASCADFPPGQFPGGNPGNGENGANGNADTNDHDCKN